MMVLIRALSAHVYFELVHGGDIVWLAFTKADEENTDPSSRKGGAQTVRLSNTSSRDNRDIECPISPPATAWCPSVVEDGFRHVVYSQQLSASRPAVHKPYSGCALHPADFSKLLQRTKINHSLVSERWKASARVLTGRSP